MTKCFNCQSPDLVIIGGAVLADTELFCDIVQCMSCFVLFATITRQVVIRLIDERELDGPVYNEPFSGNWEVTEKSLEPAKEQQNV